MTIAFNSPETFRGTADPKRLRGRLNDAVSWLREGVGLLENFPPDYLTTHGWRDTVKNWLEWHDCAEKGNERNAATVELNDAIENVRRELAQTVVRYESIMLLRIQGRFRRPVSLVELKEWIADARAALQSLDACGTTTVAYPPQCIGGKTESLILANLTIRDGERLQDAHLLFSGWTGTEVTKDHLAPYIATYFGELTTAVRAMEWHHFSVTQQGGSWIARRTHKA